MSKSDKVFFIFWVIQIAVIFMMMTDNFFDWLGLMSMGVYIGLFSGVFVEQYYSKKIKKGDRH